MLQSAQEAVSRILASTRQLTESIQMAPSQLKLGSMIRGFPWICVSVSELESHDICFDFVRRTMTASFLKSFRFSGTKSIYRCFRVTFVGTMQLPEDY